MSQEEDKIIDALYKYSYKDEVSGGETLLDSSFGLVAKEVIRVFLVDVETDNEITRRVLLKMIIDCYKDVGQHQNMPIKWFADYAMKWLSDKK